MLAGVSSVPPSSSAAPAKPAAAAAAQQTVDPEATHDLAPPEGEDPFTDADSMIVIEEDGSEVPEPGETEGSWSPSESTGLDALAKIENKSGDEKARAAQKRRATNR